MSSAIIDGSQGGSGGPAGGGGSGLGDGGGGEGGEHQLVAELLPFLASGTLVAEEAARVERHLAGCAACRGERERVAALRTAVQAPRPLDQAWAPSEEQLADLFARIDVSERAQAAIASHTEGGLAGVGAGLPAEGARAGSGVASPVEGERSKTAREAGGRWSASGDVAGGAAGRDAGAVASTGRPREGGTEAGLGGLLARLRAWWGASPSPVRWTLALQAAAVAALLVLQLRPHGAALPPDGAGDGAYHTLSRDGRTVGALPRARVVFAEEITEGELRALLRAASATIVDGPSPRGVYTLELAPTGEGGAAAAPVAERVATLAASPKVRFAQAVAP